MDLTSKSDVDQSQNSGSTPLSNNQSSICLVRVAHFRTQTKNPENQSHQCSILFGASHQKDYQNIAISCNCQAIPWQNQGSKHLSVIKIDFQSNIRTHQMFQLDSGKTQVQNSSARSTHPKISSSHPKFQVAIQNFK